MREWLELELAEALRPAEAPDELWDRVWTPRPRQARREAVLGWTAWPIAAAVLLALLAGAAWFASGKDAPPNLRQLAMEELRDETPLGLRSSDPAEVSRWLRTQTGADVALPARSGARLLGARVIRTGGAAIGAVAFRVGESDATLLVARGNGRVDSAHGRFSWSARGLNFALACADRERPEAACLLCHTNL